jgi:hypothetical protein
MANHVVKADMQGERFFIRYRREPSIDDLSPEASPHDPLVSRDTAYEFLKGHLLVSFKGGKDTLNGKPFRTLGEALEEVERLLNPPRVQPTRQISNPSRQRKRRKR